MDDILGQYNLGESSKLAYYLLAQQADDRSFNKLLDIAEEFAPKGRILDVGCNIGTFVDAAKRRGWQATGTDLNREAIQFGRERGLDLYDADSFEASGLGEFDVLHSSDTLEHFPDPVESMRYYLGKCKPGALIIVSTPNYRARLCKIFQLKPTEHVILFERTSMSHLLRTLGLELVQFRYFDRYRNLSAMFESTTFDRLPPVKQVFKGVHALAPEIIVRFPGGENIVTIARKPAAR